MELLLFIIVVWVIYRTVTGRGATAMRQRQRQLVRLMEEQNRLLYLRRAEEINQRPRKPGAPTDPVLPPPPNQPVRQSAPPPKKTNGMKGAIIILALVVVVMVGVEKGTNESPPATVVPSGPTPYAGQPPAQIEGICDAGDCKEACRLAKEAGAYWAAKNEALPTVSLEVEATLQAHAEVQAIVCDHARREITSYSPAWKEPAWLKQQRRDQYHRDWLKMRNDKRRRAAGLPVYP